MDIASPATLPVPRTAVLRDFARYVLSGCGAFLADMGSFTLLAVGFGMEPESANLISRPLAGIVSFLLHKHFTFGNRGTKATHVQLVRFWTVWALSFGVSQAAVWFYHSIIHFGPVLAKISAEGAAGVVSFVCQRQWTFK
jgi:putative flippase GtrA